MTSRRFILFAVLLLFLYLGLYTWNQRTGFLDSASTHVGLEFTGVLLKPLVVVESTVTDFWERYLDLVGVREENERLKADLIAIQSQLIQIGEDRAELERLRKLLSLPPDRAWTHIGARVIAGRMGPNAGLETVIISCGYTTGAAPGVLIVTSEGLVGRVLRASAHAATALLLTDPGSRIAVLSQKTRTPGLLMGRGLQHPMELRYVARNTNVEDGELLVTSGLDGVYPKGIAVARVVSVAPSDFSQFMQVMAQPLVDVGNLEEVLLLESTGLPLSIETRPDENFMGPPSPDTEVRVLVGVGREEPAPEPEPQEVTPPEPMGPPVPEGLRRQSSAAGQAQEGAAGRNRP